MDTREDEITEDFKKENYLFIIVPVFFRVRENEKIFCSM